jgi:hypothetical protein
MHRWIRIDVPTSLYLCLLGSEALAAFVLAARACA